MPEHATESGFAHKVELCQTLEGHQGAVYDLGLDRQGNLLSAGGDGLVVAWEKGTSRRGGSEVFDARGRALAQCGEPIFCLASMGTSGVLAGTASGGLLTIAPPDRWRQEHRHDGGTYVITERGTGGADGRWLDRETGNERAAVPGRIRCVLEVDNHAGKGTLIGTSEGRIHQEGSPWVLDAHEGAVRALLHWPGKSAFASAGGDGRMVIWRNQQEGPPERVLSVDAHKGAIYRMQAHPEGRWVATVSRDRSIALWDAVTLDLHLRVARPHQPGHMRSVNALCWLDDRTWATAGDDGRILIWKLRPD